MEFTVVQSADSPSGPLGEPFLPEQPLEKAASRRFFFRKENRVLKRSDFKKVYNEGRPWRRSLVHVFILAPALGETDGLPAISAPTRLGITATKKAGNAVHRNRARRVVRESFRHLLPDLKPGYTIVVNTMRSATTAPMAKVDAQLRDVLRQAGVLAEVQS